MSDDWLRIMGSASCPLEDDTEEERARWLLASRLVDEQRRTGSDASPYVQRAREALEEERSGRREANPVTPTAAQPSREVR